MLVSETVGAPETVPVEELESELVSAAVPAALLLTDGVALPLRLALAVLLPLAVREELTLLLDVPVEEADIDPV